MILGESVEAAVILYHIFYTIGEKCEIDLVMLQNTKKSQGKLI